jgi:hypothetical protein
MTDRPRLIEPAQTFRHATPLSQARSNMPAPPRLLLPPRLIVPASTTVKKSLWVFRTPKLELLKD